MRWITAYKNVDERDCGITHLSTGSHIRFPMKPRLGKVELSNSRAQTLSTLPVPAPELVLDFAAIEQMINASGLPLLDWVPGSGCSMLSPYHKGPVYYSIINAARQITPTDGKIAMVDLRNAASIEDARLFDIHLLNLIEDHQGLVHVDEGHVRLATWRDAIEACQHFIPYTSARHPGDIIQPQIRLRLDDSSTGSSCIMTAHSSGEYHFFQLESPYQSVTCGADEMEVYLRQCPLGWAATYGENETQRQEDYQQMLEHWDTKAAVK